MIVVSGATGALGGATLESLLRRVPAHEIAVAIRDLSKAQQFLDRGIQVRYADYEHPVSLLSAFDGADKVLMVSTPSPDMDVVRLHRNVIDAAAAVNVGHLLYTSHHGASLESPFTSDRAHAQTEIALSESGLAWTSLRNGCYSRALWPLLGPWRTTGRIEVPVDGPVVWTSRDDLAEATAIILASSLKWRGPVDLTAEAAPTFSQFALAASVVTGQEIEFAVIGEEAWVELQLASGQSEEMVSYLLGLFRAVAEGRYSAAEPLLGGLLHGSPRTVVEELVAEDESWRVDDWYDQWGFPGPRGDASLTSGSSH